MSETRKPQLKTPEMVAEAKRLRLTGLKYREIAATLGISTSAALCWVNDHINQKRIAYNRVYREKERMCKGLRGRPSRRDIENDCIERLRNVPPDTRTPAQRLMGEPIFERSALAQKLGG